ncbi:MAG: CBS and ACT domain-containing protein [Actinomycetota bacterium]|nr:CBS and ACT domain-containing protein [Actinomycetota bacterium]
MLLVRDLMTRELATLAPEASVGDALRLCRERRIRHVPIVEDEKLVGIVSDRDLREASPAPDDPNREEVIRDLRVGDIMSREVVTAHPQDPTGYAAKEMYERRLDALPVVDEEDLLGIVTSTDVMRALVMLTGVHESGSQIEVQASNKSGVLADVAEIIRDMEVDIVSALSSPEKRGGGRTMVFRLAAEDPSTVVQSLQMAGYSASWISIPSRPQGG